MPTLDLDSIREAVEAQYESVEVPLSTGKTAKFVNPIRLNKSIRDDLNSILKAFDKEEGEEIDEDFDPEGPITDALRLMSRGEKGLAQLLEDINGDLPMLIKVFEGIMKAAQVGEASASPA